MTAKIQVKYINPGDHYTRLNLLNNWDNDFVKRDSGCEGECDPGAICNKDVYISGDPRLKNMAHNGDILALDTVPRNGKVSIDDVAYIRGPPPVFNAFPLDVCSASVPSGHCTRGKLIKDIYGNIKDGDVSYYIDKGLAVPFISELFVQPGLTTKEVYVDPMGSYKPHYCRVSLDNKNCLNWIRDSQFHREDLMSKQIWDRNQSSFDVEFESHL